jgi:hypothetical protein
VHFLRNKDGFYYEELSAPRSIPKLEHYPLSAVRDWLFNIFAATLLIGGRSSSHNLRTRHDVLTATGLSRTERLLIIPSSVYRVFISSCPSARQPYGTASLLAPRIQNLFIYLFSRSFDVSPSSYAHSAIFFFFHLSLSFQSSSINPFPPLKSSNPFRPGSFRSSSFSSS